MSRPENKPGHLTVKQLDAGGTKWVAFTKRKDGTTCAVEGRNQKEVIRGMQVKRGHEERQGR